MRLQFFGDSFDVVKRFLLRAIEPEAEWAALPMFTHDVTASEVGRFAAFLGVTVVSAAVLSPETDRGAYFSALDRHQRVFLDPDTGIKLNGCPRSAAPAYLLGEELSRLCLEVPARIAVSFDQSLPRGKEHVALSRKLDYFRNQGLSGFAYRSHACFVLLSRDPTLVEQARERLLQTGLPGARLTS